MRGLAFAGGLHFAPVRSVVCAHGRGQSEPTEGSSVFYCEVAASRSEWGSGSEFACFLCEWDRAEPPGLRKPVFWATDARPEAKAVNVMPQQEATAIE